MGVRNRVILRSRRLGDSEEGGKERKKGKEVYIAGGARRNGEKEEGEVRARRSANRSPGCGATRYVYFITAEKGGAARAKGGREKDKECTTECKSPRRLDDKPPVALNCGSGERKCHVLILCGLYLQLHFVFLICILDF